MEVVIFCLLPLTSWAAACKGSKNVSLAIPGQEPWFRIVAGEIFDHRTWNHSQPSQGLRQGAVLIEVQGLRNGDGIPRKIRHLLLF